MVLQLCFVQTFPARKYQGLLLIIKMGCRAEHQCFERSPFQRGGSSLMVSVEQNAEIGIREIPGQSAGVRFIAINVARSGLKCDGGWPGRRKQGAVSLKEQYSGSQTQRLPDYWNYGPLPPKRNARCHPSGKVHDLPANNNHQPCMRTAVSSAAKASVMPDHGRFQFSRADKNRAAPCSSSAKPL